MRSPLAKTLTVLIMLGLILPGAMIMHEMPSASASPAIGRVTVSGTNILVDGAIPSEKFYGVVDTTALQFAIMTYINGETGVRGWTSVFNNPDTPNYVRSPVVPNDTPENFWHQYFALLQYYDCNLVRIGCGDTWGTSLQYNAWLNHHDAYIELLRTMCEQAEAHGVWVSLVLAGSQEYPTFTFGGSGSVFDPSSSAFSRYAAYCRDVMAELEDENAICWYDLFNEPDHNYVNQNYWKGDKVRFNNWAKAAVAATEGASTHPRTMGVAALGSLFGWNKADFDLAVGKIGVEILHVHYYGSNYDAYNFQLPEGWARQNGKPLFWGELAFNKDYPIVRYDFAEQAIWNAGGQAIASMVLTGTPGYPYRGGSLVDVHERPEEPGIRCRPPFLTSPTNGLLTRAAVAFEWSASSLGHSGYRYPPGCGSAGHPLRPPRRLATNGELAGRRALVRGVGHRPGRQHRNGIRPVHSGPDRSRGGLHGPHGGTAPGHGIRPCGMVRVRSIGRGPLPLPHRRRLVVGDDHGHLGAVLQPPGRRSHRRGGGDRRARQHPNRCTVLHGRYLGAGDRHTLAVPGVEDQRHLGGGGMDLRRPWVPGRRGGAGGRGRLDGI